MKKYCKTLNGKRYLVEEVVQWSQMKLTANFDPEWRKARSKLSKALWQDPDYRAKTIANRWPVL